MSFRRDFFAHLARAALGGALALATAVAQAQLQAPAPAQSSARGAAAGAELDAALNESVITLSKKVGPFTIDLETTVYRPDGAGPFPVAIINHGKAPGDARFQGRYRPAQAARYFLQRGYAVVVPMRQGFSKSSGSYVSGQCHVESNGRLQAEDVQAVLSQLATLPWADRERIVVVGQSHGGWTTLALGATQPAGVKGLVNFAGGLRQESCPGWRDNLVDGAEAYGRTTRLPSLWFYGDNDSFFDVDTWRRMHARYTAAGASAQLVAFGSFGTDAHNLFASRAGTSIWQPELSRFLATIGLPHEVRSEYAHYGQRGGMLPPPRTDHAPVEDVMRVPHVRDSGRGGYQAFLAKPMPRAFAIAPNGAWGWAEGGDDPLQRALNNCNRHAAGACRLYAVDDYVVWKETP